MVISVIRERVFNLSEAMAEKLIYGIQEVGIGVEDAELAMDWYARFLGFDIAIN